MLLVQPGRALVASEVPEPRPGPYDVLVRVLACGVCRTDLHLADGELPHRRRPLILGHQIVGRIEEAGAGAESVAPGDLVGIPWLGWSCGACERCTQGRENLCARARFTGHTRDGGYAELAVADARYAFPLPKETDPVRAAPLLCAGLIGYRAYRMAGPGRRLGFYGFGSAAHLLIQLALHEDREVHAFTRPGDRATQAFARAKGAAWAGGSDEPPREPLHAAIIFAAVGPLVPAALRAVAPGGTVVCAGIHMSDIPAFPYEILWEERVLRSVANLTRQDAREFLALASEIPVTAQVEAFPLEEANEALRRLRAGETRGSLVLVP